MFARYSRIKLLKNNSLSKPINSKMIKKNIKIEKPKVQPSIQSEKLEYKYFIEMHRTVWKIY